MTEEALIKIATLEEELRREKKISAALKKQVKKGINSSAGAWGIFESNIRLQKEVEKQTAEIKKTMEKAQRSSLAKSEFIASMSHELRTPLNAIIGFAQLLEFEPDITATQIDNIEEINRAGQHLLNLINDILDLAKIEAKEQKVELESVLLASVLNECRLLGTPLAKKYDVELIIDEKSYAPLSMLKADRTRLMQILLNFLSNGAKYNKPGGSLRIHCEQINKERMRINVSDTGEGFSEEEQKKLFQPFERLGAQNSTVEGTGIGLVIAKRLAEIMGAEVGAESTQGEGSTFWIELETSELYPQEESKAKLAARADIEEETSQTPASVPRLKNESWSILYIEDNPANMRLVRRIIEKHTSHKFLAAAEPRLGIELAMTHRPNLILLDIQLPEIDGFEVLKRLRQHPETQNIPVLALSANALVRDVQRGKAAGFNDYLPKPINIPSLLKAMQNALETD